MAEELVTSLINQLSTIALNEGIQQVRLVRDVREEIDKLTTSFRAIKAVINDAERRQTQDEFVKVWLEGFKEVAYDIEDVLDEWITKAQVRSHKLERAGFIRKVTSLLSTPFVCVPLKHGIASRIVEIRKRLDFIGAERLKLQLIPYPSNFYENTSTAFSPLRINASLINDSEICGRDQDKNNVLNKLLGIVDSTTNNYPDIISIVGMGGLGKTTLAQTVFNHHKVKNFFEKTVWVSVSNPFDISSTAKSIIKEAGRNIPMDSSVWDNNLQKTLRESLEGQRFLIVLDDVWNEDENKWNPLKLSLEHGAPGSRILVTTRSERVARIMGTTHQYKLGILSDDDCCSLLSRIAFQGREEEECDQLRELSILFGKRCKGLPLAAKTLGSLLRFKKTKKEWVSVSDSNVWELVDAENEYLRPALLLSYNELSSPLKSCFQYYSTLQKGCEIQKDTLIKLWMAYGLLNSCSGTEDLEFVGEGYFNALAMRSLFHNFSKNIMGETIEYCKMHDILHDLAHFLLNNKFCADELNNNLSLHIDPKAHHLTLISACPKVDDISFVYKFDKLRTLNIERFKLPFPHLLNRLRYLRVLSLKQGYFENIPNTIKELVHLRYLDLSYNGQLKRLPDSISSLYNLQTLKLNDCMGLHQLPRGIGRMVKLRHLEIVRTHELKSIPEGIGRLSLLRTLSFFVIGSASGESRIGELKNLNLLQGKLQISGFHNLKTIDEVPEGTLSEKKNLRCLTLNFNSEKGYKEDLKVEEILEKLQPHSNLAELMIYSYRCCNLKFPSWMRSNSVLLSLRKLELVECNICTELSALGLLPSLEELLLRGIANLTHLSMGECKVNQGTMKFFPKLKLLSMRGLNELEELDLGTVEEEEIQTNGGRGRGECVIMPCLEKLYLNDCKRLKSSTYHQHLLELEILTCPLISKLPSLCNLTFLMISFSPLICELPILPNLTSLTISGCQSIPELPILPNLASLEINGGILSHLPVLLNLTTLGLHDCPSISQLPILPKLSTLMCFSYKCNDLLLPKGISQLKQLQILKIEWYNLLTCIPEYIRHLTNLKELHIYTESLEVLQNRCRKDQGEDWDVISHIPNVFISCPAEEMGLLQLYRYF